jgi:uncharacterized protein
MTTESKRALVVRGGWEGHEPVVTTDLFVPFLRDNGYKVETSDTLSVYEDAARLAATDLVVQCWTMGEITKEQCEGLVGAVRAGTGFAGWHGGIVDAFRGNVDYTLLTGGQFLMHPSGFSDHAVTLASDRAAHPVIAGLSDFRVHTEKYWMATDGDIDVLATTEFAPDEHRPHAVTMPAVWTRTVRAGRVFVSTIGHKPDDFDVPEVRALTERGLLWASR